MYTTIPNYEIYKQLYLSGMSMVQIEKEYGVNRKKLSKLFKADGLDVKLNGQKYTYNDTFFESIDSEEKAYWLGFLYADGNVDNFAVNEIRVGVKSSDGDHVNKFRQLIAPDLPYRIKSTKLLGKEHFSYNFTIANKKLVEDVIDKGCVPRKSLILTFPSLWQVPAHLHHHFIRGYFDGDGSIGCYLRKSKYRPGSKQVQWNLLGTFEFLDSIQSIFEQSIEGYSRVSIKQKAGQLSFHIQKTGINQINLIYRYLYKDATVYLERKYHVFTNIYE